MLPPRDDLVAAALSAAGRGADAAQVSAIARRLAALEVHAAGPGDDGYPAAFAALANPPVAWFVRGDPMPACARAVAIVGSRAASTYGRTFAHRLASDLARLGYVIVSGLARGIDAAAHEGALAAGGRTVAVMPGGIDTIVPPHHRALAGRIAGHGSLASEHATGAPRFRGEFVKRNRLIAALGQVTVVVEAAARSGALTTAAAARRLERTVLAVPGDLDRPEAAGTLELLRTGAAPCGSAADVVAALGSSPGRVTPTKRRAPRATPARTGADPPVDGPSNRLLASLAAGPVALETLRVRAGLELDDLLAELLRLEWSGLAIRHPGGRWSGAPSRSRA